MTSLNPGSRAAIKAGCTCPVKDNCHGKGAKGFPKSETPVYWHAIGCPVHLPTGIASLFDACPAPLFVISERAA